MNGEVNVGGEVDDDQNDDANGVPPRQQSQKVAPLYQKCPPTTHLQQ